MNLQKDKWRKLHADNYFGGVDTALTRTRKFIEEDHSIFDQFEEQFQRKFPLKGKTVLEIGFGGGWYLGTPIKRGAYSIGFEVSASIIEEAKRAFEELGLTNYRFYEVDDMMLSVLPSKTVDYIFSITVFQHISPEVTFNYMRTAWPILKDDGYFIPQFLVNNRRPYKNPYRGQGNVAYTDLEIEEMIRKSGFVKAAAYISWERKDDSWKFYLLSKDEKPPDSDIPSWIAKFSRGPSIKMKLGNTAYMYLSKMKRMRSS